MNEICVLGLGYVGLPTASLLATSGFQVLGVDVDVQVVEALQAGDTRLKEAGLATLVKAAHHSGNLVAALKPQPSDTFIICVPTPVRKDHSIDLSMVKQAVKAIIPHLRNGNLVILESTSPIGTTREVVGAQIEKAGFKIGEDIHLCYCPERVLPGNTVAELVNNDRIIGGVTPDSAEHAREFYARFCQGSISVTDDKSAEMAKLMENTYRDVNIAVANVFACLAEEAGVNVWNAIEFANRHPRVNILSPGPGVGGHCIPVDPWFLINAFKECTGLLKAARETNDQQAERVFKRIVGTGQVQPGDKIAVLGAAYKPDIDDARESPAHLFVKAATDYGCKVAVHDPLVKAGSGCGFEVSNDLDACLKDSAAAVLLTNHKEYRSLSSRYFMDNMSGTLVADSRNWLNHASLRRAGFTVLVVGQG